MAKKQIWILALVVIAFIVTIVAIIGFNSSTTAQASSTNHIQAEKAAPIVVTPARENPLKVRGVPAFVPSVKAASAKAAGTAIPTFTSNEITQYLLSNPRQNMLPTSNIPITVSKVDFLTGSQLHTSNDQIYQILDSAAPDSELLCIVKITGNFQVNPSSPRSPENATASPNLAPRTFSYGYIEFDAQTGNFISVNLFK